MQELESVVPSAEADETLESIEAGRRVQAIKDRERARLDELEAIPEDQRTSAERWEIDYLAPIVGLAGYPRLLELKAVPAVYTRKRTAAEAAEMRSLQRRLERFHGRLDHYLVEHVYKRKPSAGSPRSRSQRPQARRAGSRRGNGARAPSDDGPERPRPLTGRERLELKNLVSAALRERLAALQMCQECYLELPHSEFRAERRTCKRCENGARTRRRQAVAA